jgi:2-aminoadipate transaminase
MVKKNKISKISEGFKMNYERIYSRTAHDTKKSAIRELLKLADRPEVIAFAGGWPAPELFPVEDLKKLFDKVLDERGRKVLHYSAAEGELLLKEELIRFMAKDNIHADPENIVILTGSQQGIDMLPKAFVDRGDIVFMETPTYVGAIQAFGNYGTNMIPIASDESGMIPEALADAIETLRRDGVGDRMKMVYLMPDFQNPAGTTMSEKRRIGVLEVASRNGLLVVDDAPYRYLRFEGKNLPLLNSLDKSESVVTLFSFSKMIVPGLRIAWMVGPREVIDKFVTLKQSIDLCSPALLQHVMAEYMKAGLMEKYLPKFIENYRAKRDAMLEALDREMPKLEGLHWTRPQGGLYIWVTLPETMDATELFHRAVAKDVAFVIGSAFHPQGGLKNCFRLNFSFVTFELVREGVKRLGLALADYVECFNRQPDL